MFVLFVSVSLSLYTYVCVHNRTAPRSAVGEADGVRNVLLHVAFGFASLTHRFDGLICLVVCCPVRFVAAPLLVRGDDFGAGAKSSRHSSCSSASLHIANGWTCISSRTRGRPATNWDSELRIGCNV